MKLSYERKKAWYGYLFISIWLIGFIFLFLIPFISSIQYSLSKVTIQRGQVGMESVGFQNYIELFTKNTEFLPAFTGTLTSVIAHDSEPGISWTVSGAFCLLSPRYSLRRYCAGDPEQQFLHGIGNGRRPYSLIVRDPIPAGRLAGRGDGAFYRAVHSGYGGFRLSGLLGFRNSDPHLFSRPTVHPENHVRSGGGGGFQ